MSHLDQMVAYAATVVATGTMPAEMTVRLPEELVSVATSYELAEKMIVEEVEAVVAGQEQKEAAFDLTQWAQHVTAC